MEAINILKKIEEKFLDKSKRLIKEKSVPDEEKEEYFQLLSEFQKTTEFLPENWSFALKRAFVNQGLTTPICENDGCTNYKKFNKSRSKFSIFCDECLKKDKDKFYKKRYQTIKKNIQEKYGVDNVFELDEFQEKAKNKIREKYGVKNILQLPEFRIKLQETNLKKYGVVNPMQHPEIRKKFEKTMQEKYGVSNALQSHELQEKMKKTSLEKYGVEYPIQSQAIKKKRENIFKNKLGCYPQQHHINHKNLKLINKEFIEKHFNDNGYIDIYGLMSFLNVKETFVYRLLKKYNVDLKFRKNVSMPESEIIDFINSIHSNISIITNSKKIITPYELDIYLPDFGLAIEYNGLMFHSQGISKYSIFNRPDFDENYHLKKTEACKEKNIQLLHINENEWQDPELKEIWKSVIRHKLRKPLYKIGARKLEFAQKEQLLKESKIFLEENHLQGAGAIGPIRYGLTYNGELLALMTFSKARFSKADYELVRFVIKRNWSIPGAASKLFKAFQQEHPNAKIVSYANRRWSNGNLYEKLGFQLINTSPPNFYIFHPNNPNKLWHRVSFQKHKLKNILEIYNNELTAKENLFLNGYRIIYDSGNYVYISN